MAARVCSSCGINFPPDTETCPACGGFCSQVMSEWANPDWKSRVKKRVEEMEEAARRDRPDPTILNRAGRLHAVGLDWDTSIVLAGLRADDGGYQVDVTEFEKQVRRGCPPETAARIYS